MGWDLRCAAVFAFLLVLAGCAATRSVGDGSLLRAHRLGGAELASFIDREQIRTVVHFGGFQPGDPTYRAQWQACQPRHVRWHDVTVNPHGPDREEIAQLLEIFHTAEKPILLLSNAAGDGAGLAAGLYRIVILNENKDQARRELALYESIHSPISGLRQHDQFLRDWVNESFFFERYRLADKGRLRPAASNNPEVPSADRFR